MKRRRFLELGAMGSAGVLAGCRGAPEVAAWSWSGVIFQSPVSFTLRGMNDSEAKTLTMDCLAEMKRLEAMFSLQNPDSALSRLNRDGVLRDAPEDFMRLLRLGMTLAERSGGVFDPTIQPYWKFLHEGGRGDQEAVAKLVDYRNVLVTERRVEFAKKGMAMTLNGIAQGYVTDRVASMIKSAGVEHALVNIGEFSAMGTYSEERSWTLGIRAGGAGGEIVEETTLEDEALAVSSGGGYQFGRGNHLVHPEGAFAPEGRVVAVTAPLAVIADGLATTCGLMKTKAARQLIEGMEEVGLRIWEKGKTGEWWEV